MSLLDFHAQAVAQSRLSGYATHLPMLVAAVAHTQGPVIELGCGAFSTPILHALCQGRELLSLEHDRNWYDMFARFNRGSHSVLYVPDWAAPDVDQTIRRKWSVALVDHAPGLQRVVDIRRLKSHADFIVVHDTEHLSYQYEPVFAEFRYKCTWRPYSPWTTVLSDTDNLDWIGDVARD